MQPSFFAASFLLSPSTFSSFTLPSLFLHSLILYSLFFRSPFCLLSSSFHICCLSLSLVAHPLYSSVLLSFPLPPISIWEDMGRKWEKSTEKWHFFFQKILFVMSILQNYVVTCCRTHRPSRTLSLFVISCFDLVLLFSSIFQNCDRVA